MSEHRGDAWGTSSPLVSAPRARRAAGSVGLLLDGRYRLEQRRTRDGSSSTWDGTDDQLGRPVGVRVVAGRTAQDAVDAARRSASLEDVRLARVLDVGTSQAADGGSLGWIITERTSGRPLADLLRAAPMPAARVRAIVGEAAAALARASSVGLHHRRIDPASVLVNDAGDVVVVGLEVAASAAGLAPVSSDRAEHEDVVGLVSLLYAGLTGLWPHGRFSALGAAPTSDGVPVRPADLVGGVPKDLDALVTSTLGLYDDGPRSPAELADQLTPWGSAGSGRTTAAMPYDNGPDLRDGHLASGPDDRPTAAGAGGATAVGAGSMRTGPDGTGSGDAGSAALADELFHSLESTAPHPAVFTDEVDRPSYSTDWEVPARGGASGARRASEWPQGWDDTGGIWAESSRSPGDVWEAGDAPVRRGAGRIVLALVALAVVALVVLAVANLQRIGGVLGFSTAATSASTGAAPATGTPSGSASATSATSAVPAATRIVGVHALDPLGDGSENDAQASRAIDGNPSTAWSSSTYRSASFGGLKSGLGLSLDLGASERVSSLDLRVAGSGGTVQVRASTDGSYQAGSAVLATAAVGSGTGAPVHVALARPTDARYLVVWFTALPSTPTGFSAQVAEVAVH